MSLTDEWRFSVFLIFHSPLTHVCVYSIAQSCLTSAAVWTVACQAPLSREFSRQEYWSQLPFPTPGIFPDLGIKPTSLMSPELAGGSFTTRTIWETLLPIFLNENVNQYSYLSYAHLSFAARSWWWMQNLGKTQLIINSVRINWLNGIIMKNIYIICK